MKRFPIISPISSVKIACCCALLSLVIAFAGLNASQHALAQIDPVDVDEDVQLDREDLYYTFLVPPQGRVLSVRFSHLSDLTDYRTDFSMSAKMITSHSKAALIPVASSENFLWLWEADENVRSPYRRIGAQVTSSLNTTHRPVTPLIDQAGSRLWRLNLQTDMISRFDGVPKVENEVVRFEGLLPDGSPVFSTSDAVIAVQDGQQTLMPLGDLFVPFHPRDSDPFVFGQVQGGRIVVSQESGCLAYNRLESNGRVWGYWSPAFGEPFIRMESGLQDAHLYINTIGPNCELGVWEIPPARGDVTAIPRSSLVFTREDRSPLRFTPEINPGELSIQEQVFNEPHVNMRSNRCRIDPRMSSPMVVRWFADGSGLFQLLTSANYPILFAPPAQPVETRPCTFFYKPEFPAVTVENIFAQLALAQGFDVSAVATMERNLGYEGHLQVASAGFGPAVTFVASHRNSGTSDRRPFRMQRPFTGYPHNIADYVSPSPSRN